MAATVYVLLATFLFAQCLADTPDIIKDGKKQFDETWAKMMKELGLSKDPTGDEIVKLVRAQNDKLASNVKELQTKIEEQIKSNPDAATMLNNVKAKLNEAAEKLKKENPEVAQNAQKLGDSMKGAWDTLAQELEKGLKEFNKAGGKRDEIDNLMKSIIDKGTAAAKELQGKIEEAVKKT